MLILSHRGFHRNLPENTLEAFQAAVEFGADGIETDLRLTADGALVLIHDRVTPDGRRVDQVTHAELQRLLGHNVPLAQAALERWPDLLWNLEIKTPAAVPRTLELISRFKSSHRLLITSFWHTVVEQIAQQAEVDCGLLVSHRASETAGAPFPLTTLAAGAPAWRRRISSIVWCYEFLDPTILAAASQAGYRNFCYNIVTAEEHTSASAWGLDGIITDHLDLLLPQGAR